MNISLVGAAGEACCKELSSGNKLSHHLKTEERQNPFAE
jgi:hypothetical protein